eukprot:833295-Prymnesium_polylepis.1
MSSRGWNLVNIGFSLQYDSCSCGVWILVARDAFAEYIDSALCGTKSFVAFFKGWLAQRGVKDMDEVQGVASRRVGGANNHFICDQRAEMRAVLVQLAIEGKLAYEQALLPGFSSKEVVVADDDDCFM